MSPNVAAVNFGDTSMYSGGAFLPDGKYCLYFTVMQHQPVDRQSGAPKGKSNLGVMIDFYPLSNPVEEAKLQKFYSMGQKADESYAPNPETGKGIVLIPGAKGQNLNDKTNWMMMLNSLEQSGLPKGVFTNDISVIDGTWAYIANVDEPEERKGFQSATGEVQALDRKPAKIPVVSEILENGKPWEGTGGWPTGPIVEAAPAVAARPVAAPARVAAPPVAAARPVAVPPAAAGRPVAVRPAVRPAPAPAAGAPPATGPLARGPVGAPALAPVGDAQAAEDLHTYAQNGIGDVLAVPANLNGMRRLDLRNATFSHMSTKYGEDIAGQVIDAYFEPAGAANFTRVLGELGFKSAGPQVMPL